MVDSEGSVTRWIGEVKQGDEAAAQRLWERYFEQLSALCRKRIPNAARQLGDEEDVVLSVFDSFCRGAKANRFPQLADRDNLWRLLVVMTARKAINFVRDQQAEKRGGGQVLGEWALDGSHTDARGIEAIIGEEPTPEFAAMVAEECERLLAALDDPVLRTVTQRKLEGFTNEEIAEQLGCSVRTVERKLWVIRSKWSQGQAPDQRNGR
jgi:RNA polymerase sigma factor (sigma-70 family)